MPPKRARCLHYRRRADPTYRAALDSLVPLEVEPFEETIITFVYFARVRSRKLLKIGFTTDPRRRLGELKSETGFEHDLIGCVRGGRELERLLKRRFAGKRVLGEWFSDEILPEIERILSGEPERVAA